MWILSHLNGYRSISIVASLIPIHFLTTRLETLKHSTVASREAKVQVQEIGVNNLAKFSHGDTCRGYLDKGNLFHNKIILIHLPCPPMQGIVEDTRQAIGHIASAICTGYIYHHQICLVLFNLWSILSVFPNSNWQLYKNVFIPCQPPLSTVQFPDHTHPRSCDS